ncbi:hypothetical protein MJ579_06645 [Klebsiella pneumoniae]|nr:hypothetical protein MJ579_06645 [Klebsiella pneumoniae]
MIQQARRMIADGLLGEIRIVNMQFAHGFRQRAVELQARSTWRVTPVYQASYGAGSGHPSALFVAETMAPAAQYQTADVAPVRALFPPARRWKITPLS